MNELLAKQHSLFHSVSRSLENFKKIGKTIIHRQRYDRAYLCLKTRGRNAFKPHSALLQSVPEVKWASIDYFHNKAFDSHKDIYQETLDYMAESLEAIEPAGSANLSVIIGVSFRPHSFYRICRR